MKLLEQEILNKGRVLKGDVLKVDGFLNHQLDVGLLSTLGKECAEHFKSQGITKVLTVEASGIAFSCFIAYYLGVSVLFAKKNKTSNLTDTVYSTQVMSYTHGRVYDIFVSKDYLHSDDKVLIADDFLANGEAVNGLRRLIEQAGASLAGVAIAVEKGFQKGGDKLRAEGIDLLSLAVIDEMSEEDGIRFRSNQ